MRQLLPKFRLRFILSGKCSSRLLKNAHFVFARDGRNWLDFEEAFVEQA